MKIIVDKDNCFCSQRRKTIAPEKICNFSIFSQPNKLFCSDPSNLTHRPKQYELKHFYPNQQKSKKDNV